MLDQRKNMRIGDIFKIETPTIEGEHRAVILYEDEASIAFTIMTSQVQKQTDYLKKIGYPKEYIQKTLVIIEAPEYQSEKNHKLCSLTCKTAINTNNIKFCRPDVITNKVPCDALPQTLLKKVCEGIQASESIDEETKNTIQQEYNRHHAQT